MCYEIAMHRGTYSDCITSYFLMTHEQIYFCNFNIVDYSRSGAIWRRPVLLLRLVFAHAAFVCTHSV